MEESIRTALRSALDYPLGFAGLNEVVFPGDRLVLATDAQTAREPDILQEIVYALLEAGLATPDIALLFAEEEKNQAFLSLSNFLPEGMRLLFHRPESRDDLALLGVDSNDEPIALNRAIVDADVVITLGQYDPKLLQRSNLGIHAPLFPRFSDKATQQRFSEAKGIARRQLRAEVNEVARRLGVLFTIQVLFSGGRAYECFAGLPELVLQKLAKIR